MSDSEDYLSKSEMYEEALVFAKKDILELLKKIPETDIIYSKVVCYHLCYDPDDPDAICQEVIEDLQSRMEVELKCIFGR